MSEMGACYRCSTQGGHVVMGLNSFFLLTLMIQTEPAPCAIQLHMENDTGTSDRGYTQGMRLAAFNCMPFATPELERGILRGLGKTLGFQSEGTGTRYETGLAVGQNIYTPWDERPEIDYTD